MAETPLTAETTTDRCYLLELPPEIRLMIYDYTFEHRTKQLYTRDEVVHYPRPKRAFSHNRYEPQHLHYTALLQVCSLVNREARPLLSRNIAFEFDARPFSHPAFELAEFRFLAECEDLKIYLKVPARSMKLTGAIESVRDLVTMLLTCRKIERLTVHWDVFPSANRAMLLSLPTHTLYTDGVCETLRRLIVKGITTVMMEGSVSKEVMELESYRSLVSALNATSKVEPVSY